MITPIAPMEPDQTPDIIAAELSRVFNTEGIKISVDPFREILYVRIPGLNSFTEKQIEELAGPVLEDFDADFEEIVLLDLPQK